MNCVRCLTNPATLDVVLDAIPSDEDADNCGLPDSHNLCRPCADALAAVVAAFIQDDFEDMFAEIVSLADFADDYD